MKLKKFTQKDRYGNTTSYEFEGDTKPLDPTALMKAQMEQMGNIPDMMAPPPVGGEEFKMGNPMSHPGEPRGDDTVPAWLTPGEFVVNAEAMSIPGNAEMVEQINNQGRAMQQGGEVEYANIGKWITSQAAKFGAGQAANATGGVIGGEEAANATNLLFGPFGALTYALTPKSAGASTPTEADFAYEDMIMEKPIDYSVEDMERAAIADAGYFQGGGMIPVHDEPVPTAPWRNPIEGLDDLLHEREGWRDAIYLDSLGKPTVGAGHLIADEVWEKDDPRIGTKPYSEEELHEMFAKDRDAAVNNAINNVGRDTWMQLNPAQQRAMASMAFQLGAGGQRNFANMLAAVKAGDYDEAARQALTGSEPGTQSKWLKQTPKRAFDLAEAFSPTVAAQYRNAGGVVYAEEGGGFWDWLTTDNRPESMKGKSEQKTDAPPTFGGADLTAAGQEPPVPEDIFPPQFRQGHPYADAVPYSDGSMSEAEMAGAFGEGDVLGGMGEGNHPMGDIPTPSAPPPVSGSGHEQYRPGEVPLPEGPVEADPSAYIPDDTMGPYIPEGGSYNPFEDERTNMARLEEERIAREMSQSTADSALDQFRPQGPSYAPMPDSAIDQFRPTGPSSESTQHPLGEAVAMTGMNQVREEKANNKAYRDRTKPSDMTIYDWKQKVMAGEFDDEDLRPEDDTSDKKPTETISDYKKRKHKERMERRPDMLGKQPSAPPPKDPTNPEDTKPKADPMTAEGELSIEQVLKDADKATAEQARSEAKSIFSDLGLDGLFDKKELARMAVMYAGSRLLGYEHGGSLQWAAENYLNRVDAKEKGYTQLALSGKYTPESLKLFKKTGNYEDLLPVGATPEQTGEYKDFYSPNGKITGQKVKVGDQTVWMDSKGNIIDGTQWNEDPSNVKGTKEYRERTKVYINNTKDQLSSLRNQFDRFGEGDNVGYKTDINPATSAGKIAEWAHANNIEPEELSGLVESAYHEAMNDQRQDGSRVRSIVPYLNNLIIRQSTDNPDAFLRKEQPDEKGAPRQYIDGQKMNDLKGGALAVMKKAGKKGDDFDLQNQFWNAALTDWNNLTQKERDKYNAGAPSDLNGFYMFTNELITTKLSGG